MSDTVAAPRFLRAEHKLQGGANLLPPANEVCEGYVFTPVSHSVHRGGVCGRGACVAGGHAWWRGMRGQGGMCGGGACVAGGHAWQGGMCGRGCACHAHLPLDTTRYGRPMRGRYASYWNAFLLVGQFVSTE